MGVEQGGTASFRLRERLAALHWQVALCAAPVAVLILFGLAIGAERLATTALRRQALQGLEAARVAGAAAAARWIDAAARGIERAATDPSMARAAGDLVAATHAVEHELRADPASQESGREQLRERLTRYYESNAAIDAGRLLPTGREAVWLQSRYFDGAPAPRDDSAYGAAHADWHPTLAGLAASADFADLLLVRMSDGQVVYSVAKSPLFQTSLLDGPYADSHLGALVRRLRSAAVPRAQWADFAPFTPARGQSVAFVGAPVAANGEVAGLVIAALAPAGLTRAVNGDGAWRELGLGASGDLFVTGDDGTLRSVPRAAATTDRGARRGAAAVPALMAAGGGSGAAFIDQYLDVRGVSRLAASAPLAAGALGWRVTAEMDADEALREASALRRNIGLLATGLAALLVLWIAAAAAWTSAPLRRLVTGVERLRASDPLARLRVPGGGEVAALSAGVNGLLDQSRNAAVADRRRREAELRGLLAVLDAARAGDCAERAYAGGEFASLADSVNAVCEQLRDRPASPTPVATSDALHAAAEHLRCEAARHLDVLTAAAGAAEQDGGRDRRAARLATEAAAHARVAGAAAESGLTALGEIGESLAALQRAAAAGEHAAGALAARAEAASALRERLADLSTELSVMAVNAALAAHGAAEALTPADDAGRIADATAAACDEIDEVLAGAQDGAAAARTSSAQQLAALEHCAGGAARAHYGAAQLQASLAACLALLDEQGFGGAEADSLAAVVVARDSARRLCHAADVVAREASALAVPRLHGAEGGSANGACRCVAGAMDAD